MIKYKYAYNSNREIIGIDSLSKETKNIDEKYICISCDKILIPKLGKVRIKHFAHKEYVVCNRETYLHKLGKEIFFQEYNNCIVNNQPFYIEYKIKRFCNNREKEFNKVCYIDKVTKIYDLTQIYTGIKYEKREVSFIPDILLIHKNGIDKLFIEIAVTHFSSDNKINSGNRIIEISIDDEQDLNIIKDHFLNQDHPKVIFMNFKYKDDIGDHCGNSCIVKYHYFVVFNDGRCIQYPKSLSDISYFRIRQKDNITDEVISEDTGNGYLKYKYLIAKMVRKGVKAKNCFICQYHSLSEESEENKPILCYKTKMTHNSNKAIDCKTFKVDDFYINKFIDDGKYLFEV
jgi:hypothetical protein